MKLPDGRGSQGKTKRGTVQRPGYEVCFYHEAATEQQRVPSQLQSLGIAIVIVTSEEYARSSTSNLPVLVRCTQINPLRIDLRTIAEVVRDRPPNTVLRAYVESVT